ncbi:miraculin-like [Dorcoceras hygrometricum]|uniref:Miraculin-like n=1 Tax=Dorcoceras hygrometricum TaxID=472368 RepID=A0A2Z7BLJ0_9LAMI|nr:miraculin-like [Dorcoceras hygrometricum]
MITADAMVYDTGMNPLRPDTPYYLMPGLSNSGGGIYTREDNGSCFVYSQPIDDLPSEAVIFKHDTPDMWNMITQFKDLNIILERPKAGCAIRWFQIERVDLSYSYQLTYCPTVCDQVNVTCKYVGVDKADGIPRLALSDVPHLVRFHKPCPCNKL